MCQIVNQITNDDRPEMKRRTEVKKIEENDNNVIIGKKIAEINLLNETEKKIKSLLLKYNSVFSNKPGLCNKFRYTIKLKSYEPFKSHSYPIPICHQSAVTKEINEMLNQNIIERSNSTYINSMLVVPKSNYV